MQASKAQSSTACRPCADVRDIVPLCQSQHLYLKPLARINISVQLPQLKTPGKSISSWEVMERLRKMARPEKFCTLRVTKSTLEFIRFEGEIDSKDKLKGLVELLDMKTIKLSGFPDALKVRAAEAKLPFPTRHVWDSFFREAKNMDEMKPGERPDTIHIANLPCKWFTLPELQEKDPKPSEFIFRKVFETFGEVRYVDVPCIDPYRARMKSKSAIKMFSFDDGVMFEGYVQYKEYVGFLKAMSALKGMMLMYKDKEKTLVAPIRVDFDRTKHMTDHSIKKRHVERERLVQQDAELLQRERKFIESVEAKKDKEIRKKEAEHLDALIQEEEKIEKKKKLEMEKIKKAEKQRKKIKKKLAQEEQRLKMAQAKLENVELLEILLEKAKKKQKKSSKKKKKKEKDKKDVVEPICSIVDQVVESVKDEEKDILANRELELRKRLLLKYKRNLITKIEPKAEEEEEESDPGAAIVEATIAEVDAEQESSDAETSVTSKSAAAEDDSPIKVEEDDKSSSDKATSEDESEEDSKTPSESEGEIKSEGEASDTESETSIGLTSNKSPSLKNKSEPRGETRDTSNSHEKNKTVDRDSKAPVTKLNSHVEVVSNHWKRTTHHYTDRDGKRRGDTWIEGKQVYEVGSGGMPPWACPSDFYPGQKTAGVELYDKYFEKFRGRRGGGRARGSRRGRSVSRDRSADRLRRRSRSRDRYRSRRRSRSYSRRSRSASRGRRSLSRDRRSSVRKSSPKAQRQKSESPLSLSPSRSRSRSRSRSSSKKQSKSRERSRFRARSKSSSPPSMKVVRKAKKAPKVSPVKPEVTNVKERPKPLIMKMPSKRLKKTPPSVTPALVKEEPAPDPQSVPDMPASELVPEQAAEQVTTASPIVEQPCSPVRSASPVQTHSIPLPDSPSKEVPQSVQEVPVFEGGDDKSICAEVEGVDSEAT